MLVRVGQTVYLAEFPQETYMAYSYKMTEKEFNKGCFTVVWTHLWETKKEGEESYELAIAGD